jgi:hypothetical protein
MPRVEVVEVVEGEEGGDEGEHVVREDTEPHEGDPLLPTIVVVIELSEAVLLHQGMRRRAL